MGLRKGSVRRGSSNNIRLTFTKSRPSRASSSKAKVSKTITSTYSYSPTTSGSKSLSNDASTTDTMNSTVTTDLDAIKKITPEKMTKTICNSIRSFDEPHLRCLMPIRPDQKYCSMHLVQKNIVDFRLPDIDIDDILDRDEKMSEPIRMVGNEITRTITLTTTGCPKLLTRTSCNKTDKIIDGTNDTNGTMREQKVSTIENSHKENEDDLEIKLLILANDDEYCDKISELIGPVFKDVTLSEDEQDPVTLDSIWTIKNGIKIPAAVNKYYLFSYRDSKDKIRCLTIFTIFNMFQDNNYIHPVTSEAIPEKDVERAKELIDLYQTKIGLFKEQDESNMSPEFKLKNRLTRLFKQFHIHSIYLEENWLINIDSQDKLFKIIKETEKLVSNNIKSINPDLHGFKVFQKKELPKKMYNKNKTSTETIMSLQEYIVDEWEKLIDAADTPQNQIPIWILASGLSFAVPEVKQKYPDLEIML